MPGCGPRIRSRSDACNHALGRPRRLPLRPPVGWPVGLEVVELAQRVLGLLSRLRSPPHRRSGRQGLEEIANPFDLDPRAVRLRFVGDATDQGQPLLELGLASAQAARPPPRRRFPSPFRARTPRRRVAPAALDLSNVRSPSYRESCRSSVAELPEPRDEPRHPGSLARRKRLRASRAQARRTSASRAVPVRRASSRSRRRSLPPSPRCRTGGRKATQPRSGAAARRRGNRAAPLRHHLRRRRRARAARAIETHQAHRAGRRGSGLRHEIGGYLAMARPDAGAGAWPEQPIEGAGPAGHGSRHFEQARRPSGVRGTGRSSPRAGADAPAQIRLVAHHRERPAGRCPSSHSSNRSTPPRWARVRSRVRRVRPS